MKRRTVLLVLAAAGGCLSFNPFHDGAAAQAGAPLLVTALASPLGRGGPSTGSGQAGDGAGPAVGNRSSSQSTLAAGNLLSGGTEAPDETAHREWLNLVAKAASPT